jgi:hypothetical protein
MNRQSNSREMEIVGGQIAGKRIFQCHRSVGVILDDRIGPYLLRILHHGGIIGEQRRIELDHILIGLEVHDLVLSGASTKGEGVAAAIAVKDVIPSTRDQRVIPCIENKYRGRLETNKLWKLLARIPSCLG